MQIDTSRERSRLVAVLGPTNTGKTHLAMERMLGHPSGMIGFPLRLLARENYDRAVRLKGRTRVALITGEEKIVPTGAQYFMCTVEAMPLAREVSFLAIDEIQMCADADRGHVFTERLLHARGTDETMFLGAETIRALIRRLVPDIDFISRPRFSTLSYTGHRKITRLPARSAVVAFSAADVYAIAEMIRRQRGGAAVVLGALSPRTRNAQVEMYQAGEVDYLVATDAIGMGLNMDVGHVAFAATRKFDGHMMRALTPAELAQIAGRAGRHMNDGTFGTTDDEGPLDPATVESVENHAFEPLKHLSWRNGALEFQSIEALQASLTVAPEIKGLVRARTDDDERALALLTSDAEIAGLARGRDAVRLLWEVCRIPDFSKISVEAHTALLGRVYRHLAGPDGRLPTDWIAERVAQIDRIDGDIETIAGRIAQIRTWTTIAFHADWLTDAAHWQARTRDVEDRLSDALHDSLTKRFVDKRTAVLMRRLKERSDLVAVVRESGEVEVEGQFVGHLAGFCFTADRDQGARTGARKAIHAAAERALMREIEARIERLEADGDDALTFGDGTAWDRIEWRGEPIARLVPGAHVLNPAVELLPGGLLEPDARERIRRRLAGWLDSLLKRDLAPLYDLGAASLNGAARGLAFRLAEGLGALPRDAAAEQIKALKRSDRQTLRRLGVRLGRESVYMPTLLKARAIVLRGMLWGLGKDLATLPLPEPGRVSLKAENAAGRRFLEAIGYRATGPLSVRIDMIERLSGRAWSLSRSGPFAASADLMSIAGCTADDLGGILGALGYRQVSVEGSVAYTPKRGRKPRAKQPPAADVDSDSPFAKLRNLVSS